MIHSLEQKLAESGLDIGFKIRQAINKIPVSQRGVLTKSVLKPGENENSRFVDAEGERICFDSLTKLSQNIKHPIHIIINPQKEQIFKIGNGYSNNPIFCYFDAVDGTIKVAGLGNDSQKEIYRVGNNGYWATGISFTLPTNSDIQKLKIGDFVISAIVEGNPQRYRSHPTNAFCFPQKGVLKTFEKDEQGINYQLSTSSQDNLSQSTIVFDAFQAHDRRTASENAEQLSVKIFQKLINRNTGGAFDIVRLYSSMGETLSQLLERYEGGIESQGVGYVSINENLSNIVPIYSIVYGAGGYIVDFQRNQIGDRTINSSRPNVVIAANDKILEQLIKITKFASS